MDSLKPMLILQPTSPTRIYQQGVALYSGQVTVERNINRHALILLPILPLDEATPSAEGSLKAELGPMTC
jgi:hypothetical protein